MEVKDGETIEVKIFALTVSQVLCTAEGNSLFNRMKLMKNNKLMAFNSRVASQQVYDNLKEPKVILALQIFQQNFHFLKPQNYTHFDEHGAHIFSLAQQAKENPRTKEKKK